MQQDGFLTLLFSGVAHNLYQHTPPPSASKTLYQAQPLTTAAAKPPAITAKPKAAFVQELSKKIHFAKKARADQRQHREGEDEQPIRPFALRHVDEQPRPKAAPKQNPLFASHLLAKTKQRDSDTEEETVLPAPVGSAAPAAAAAKKVANFVPAKPGAFARPSSTAKAATTKAAPKSNTKGAAPPSAFVQLLQRLRTQPSSRQDVVELKSLLQQIPDDIDISPLHNAILEYTKQALSGSLTGGGQSHLDWYKTNILDQLENPQTEYISNDALVNILLAAANSSNVPEQYIQDCEYYKQLLMDRKISLLRPIESLDHLKAVIADLRDKIQQSIEQLEAATNTYTSTKSPTDKLIVDQLQEQIEQAGTELEYRTQERNARSDFMEELNEQLKPVMAFGLRLLRQLLNNIPTTFWRLSPFCMIKYENAATQNAPNALSKLLYKEYPALVGSPPNRRYAQNPTPTAFMQTLCNNTPYSEFLEGPTNSIEMFPKRQTPDVQVGQAFTLTYQSGTRVNYVVKTVHANSDVELEVTDPSSSLPPLRTFCAVNDGADGVFVYASEHVLVSKRAVRVVWCKMYNTRVVVRTQNYTSSLHGVILTVDVARQTLVFRTYSFMASMAISMNSAISSRNSFTAAVYNMISTPENMLFRLIGLSFLTASKDAYLDVQDMQRGASLPASYDRSDAPESILDGIENSEARKQFIEAISVAKMFLIEQWAPGTPLHGLLSIEPIQEAAAQLQALAKRNQLLRAYSCSDSMLQLLSNDAPAQIQACAQTQTVPSYEEFFNITQTEQPRPVTALGKRPPVPSALGLQKRVEGGYRTLGNYQST